MTPMRFLRIAPWVAAAAVVGGLACVIWLDAMTPEHGDGVWIGAGWLIATFISGAVGLVLATRRPSNPIGWLVLANALVLVAFALADEYADYAVLGHPGASPAARGRFSFNERAWPLLFVSVTAIAWIFPDGRLPSPRWRPFAIAATASFAVLVVLSLLAAERFSAEYDHVASPLPELSLSVIGGPRLAFGLGALASLVGGALAMRTRLRRSSGVERQQVKWLAYAVVLIPAAVVICVMEIAITGDDGPSTTIALVVALGAIPAAIGIAVMRYRLYEIDRLINRTLVYAVLSAGLAAVFAAVSLSLGVAIGSGSTRRHGGGDPGGRGALRAAAHARPAPRRPRASTGRATRGCAPSSGSSPTCARDARRRRPPGRCWPRPSAIQGCGCSSGCPTASVDVDARAASWASCRRPGPRPHAGAPGRDPARHRGARRGAR